MTETLPELDPVEKCIAYLAEHGDWYGVELLKEMPRVGQEDPKNP